MAHVRQTELWSAMELKCPGCSARFRLTLTADDVPDGAIDCPKCGTPIPVASPAPAGWAPRERASIFGRTPESKPASRTPNKAPTRGTPKRVFKDITKVSSDAPPPRPPRDDDEETSVKVPVEAPQAKPEELRREAAPAEPPEPEKPSPDDSSPYPIIEDDGLEEPDEQRDPTLERGLPSAAIVKRSGIGDRASSARDDDSASTAELLRLVRKRSTARVRRSQKVHLRVGKKTFDDVTVPQLAEVIARGVLPETVRVRLDESDDWELLSEHPIYDFVRHDLEERSEAVLEEVLTGEPEREVASSKDESPEGFGEAPPTKPAIVLAKIKPMKAGLAMPPAPSTREPTESEKTVEIPVEIPVPVEQPAPPKPPAPPAPPKPPAPPNPVAAPPLPEPPEQTPVPDVAESAEIEIPPEAPEAPEAQPEELPPAASSISMELAVRKQPRWHLPAVFIMVAIGAGATAAYVWAPHFREPPPKIAPAPAPPPPKSALRLAFSVADTSKELANETAKLRSRDTDTVMAEAEDMLSRSNFGDALSLSWELRRRAPNNPKATEMLARAYAGTGDWHGARRVIAELAARREISDKLKAAFRTTLQADPALPPPTATFTKDVPVDMIKALGGGRSLSFKVYHEGEKRYAFKPAQTEWDDGWRAEIAAYTLCQLLPCVFDVPESFTARVEQDTWQGLYPLNTVKQAEYATEFERLKWRTEPNEKGEEVQVLYGVAKIWVPGFTDFPIEYTDVWHPWVDATGDASVLELPLDQSLQGLQGRGEYYEGVLGEAGSATTLSVARQLSNIMVFDFLINNWDRFSTVEDYYGVNNQFADGKFVSIDNGAGFQFQASERVDSRFRKVTRFSKSMIAAVRLLDRDLVDPLLFPNPTEQEEQRLDQFWKRREELLARVDELVEEHGAEQVLYFD